MYELLDIYDENRNKTGKTIERKDGNTLNKSEYIICVHCWIINSSKKILLTQRKLNKKRGGLWECTGGCVKSGETSIEGIQRELNEELGIYIDSNELTLVKTLKEERSDLNILRDIYIVHKDINLQNICFNDGEVISCKYVSIDELNEMIKNKECAFNNLKIDLSLYT